MTSPSAPGYVDDHIAFDSYGVVLDYLLENIPELTHPQSITTYSRMRRDPQIAAVLRAYKLAIGRAHWAVDGAGCRDEVTAQIADDLGLPILGYDIGEPDPENPERKVMPATGARRRRFTWAEHLRLALSLSITYGHAPFAQAWDDQYRLLAVQERMPQTISSLKFNDDGTLKAAEQYRLPGKPPPIISTANHELVWYAREREGSNYYGQSLIREAYAPWLIKTQILRVWATSNRRNGMGVWEVTAPPGATPQQIAEAHRIATSVRAGENSGLGLPNGFSAVLRGLTGTLPDNKELADYCDRQVTRSTLTSILDMATAEKGNRSLGETVMALMVYAQQSEANRIAQDGTTQIAIPLVDAAWGEDEPAPRIVCGDVGADPELTAQDLNWVLQYGGLQPDKPFRSWYRQRQGIPPEDPNYTPPVQGAPAPTGGAA